MKCKFPMLDLIGFNSRRLFLAPQHILSSGRCIIYFGTMAQRKSSEGQEVRASGTVVNVPDNPLARLQYYINTVLGLIDIPADDSLQQIKNAAFTHISFDGIPYALEVCAKLQPEVFLKKCVFIEPQLCSNHNNEFYQAYQVINLLPVGTEVIIDGKRKTVRKIMAIKKEWLTHNYYTPLKQLTFVTEESQKRQKNLNLKRAVSLSEASNNPEGCFIM